MGRWGGWLGRAWCGQSRLPGGHGGAAGVGGGSVGGGVGFFCIHSLYPGPNPPWSGHVGRGWIQFDYGRYSPQTKKGVRKWAGRAYTFGPARGLGGFLRMLADAKYKVQNGLMSTKDSLRM